MTHPKEAVELLSAWMDEYSVIDGDLARQQVAALLDAIAPLYREQAAQVADKQAALSGSNDYDIGWCRSAAVIAAAIRKGE
jgi:hypothetical protein